jgi:hypothetical protein
MTEHVSALINSDKYAMPPPGMFDASALAWRGMPTNRSEPEPGRKDDDSKVSIYLPDQLRTAKDWAMFKQVLRVLLRPSDSRDVGLYLFCALEG